MILQHPKFDKCTVDVPKGDVKSWKAAGWIEPGKTKTDTPEDVPVDVVEVNDADV